jgi:cephalosporin-C deacetylase
MYFKKIIPLVTLLALLLNYQPVFAQHDGEEEEKEEIFVDLVAGDDNATFSDAAKYTFTVKNESKVVQEGTVSYQVTTPLGKEVKTASQKVKIPVHSTGKYHFTIPGLPTGFYKANFMVNISEYDDTVRKAFGIRPDQIRSQFKRPADFKSFWDNTRAELAKVRPDFKWTEMPDSSRDNRRVFLVEMKSLDNLTIRGWVTIPKTKRKHKKFAVLLGLPGYQVALKPMFGSDEDLAIFTLNVRGQGNSRDVIATERDAYISHHIEDKNKYVMRGAIMDCLRAVEFIRSRPEFRHDAIMVSGGSMGGFLSIATAALTDKVQLCSAQNPILSDIRNLDGAVDWPMTDIKKYAKTNNVKFETVLNTMDYFDCKNFAPDIKCGTLLGIGLLDHIIPPANEYAVYNNFGSKKHIIIFKDLGHEVAAKYKNYEGRWMRDTFALF